MMTAQTIMKMTSWILLVYALTIVGASRVYLGEDGGYRGIIVRIHPDVRESTCSQLLQNIQTVISESSSLLYKATAGRAWFGQVSIVIPALWTDTQCRAEVKYPAENVPYKGEDIAIVSEDPVFGSLPVTEQSQPCGQPGDRIRTAQHFFADLNRTAAVWGRPSRLLLKEWSKYRYGVFDDHGYPGDPLYPAYFLHRGDRVLPSGTTNAMVRGSWRFAGNGTANCDPRTGSVCLFKPEGRNEQVTCSLNFLPFLDSVDGWCGPDTLADQPVSPTKHNVLCRGKSVLEVINAHADFQPQDNPASEAVIKMSPTVFNIVRQPPPEYVIVLETSSSMASVWKWVRKALQNLIRFELPDNSRVAIVTFNKETKVEQDLMILTNEVVRVRVADSIPDSPNKLSRLEDRCVNCGVQVAMDTVLKNREAGGHIILITQGDSRSLSRTDEANIANYESYYNVRISSVIVPLGGGNGRQPLPFYRRIADQSGGKFFAVDASRSGSIYLLSDLIVALRNIVGVDSTPVPATLHINKVDKLMNTTVSRGTFFLDAALGRDTKFGVFVEDDEDHGIKAIQLTDQLKNKTYGPYPKMSSDFDIVNFKTINFRVGDQLPFQEVGVQWTYEITWFPGTRKTANVVMVTSKQKNPDPSKRLQTSVWSSSVPPYAIYCKVTMGGLAVHNADVRLHVGAQTTVNTNISGQQNQSRSFSVLDDGVGDPDLQSGDGVYSLILPSSALTSSATLQQLQIVVTDNAGGAYTATSGPPLIGQPRDLAIPVCCGARIPVAEARRKYLATFRHSLDLNLPVEVRHQAENNIVGVPGKIADLVVQRNGSEVHLKWTAVDGDRMAGGSISTAMYRVYFAADISELVLFSAEDYVDVSQQDIAGQPANLTLLTEDRTGYVYVGMRAGNPAGNFGRMSNLVLVDLGEPSVLPVPAPEPSATGGDWTLIGIILGVIFILVLCLFVLVLSIICGKRSKKLKGLKTKTKSSGVNVHIPSPSRSEATDVSYDSDHQLVPTMSKPPPVSHTSFANNITPTYWSASQLLTEHEQRTGTLGRKSSSNNNNNSSSLAAAVENKYGVYQQHNNNDVYNGYTITPLNSKTSHYGDYGLHHLHGGDYGVIAGNYTTYVGPSSQDIDYGTVVMPRNVEEFQHLDYGIVSDADYGSDMVEEGLEEEEVAGNRSTTTGQQQAVNISDVSSSTLPMFNPSLRGSLISLNSAKKKNITQV